MTIAEIGRRLRARELSVRELTEHTLAEIEREQPRLNAFITITGEAALARADELDAMLARGDDLGPLHGIPVAHKDCFYTQGVRTTGGSKAFADFVPNRDAEVVRRLHSAGMVMVGKTGLHELTYGITNINAYFGNVHNPHDALLNKRRVSGGSSGGSGAAVGAGLVPAATGTDTGGSIRIPASFCGCVGLKPTYDRISRDGVMALGPSQDHVGPMAASVADTALLYEAMLGIAAGASVGSGEVRGLRIGIPENYFWDNLAPEVRFSVRGAVQIIGALGALPREFRVPEVAPLMEVARITLLYEAAASFADIDLNSLGDDVRGRIEEGRRVTSEEYAQAQTLRRALAGEFAPLWRDLDLLIVPTTPMTAFPIEGSGLPQNDLRPEATRLTRPFNLLGWPALSLPCGVSSEGLPIGVQLVAAPGNEDVLFCAGSAIEAGVKIPIKKRP